MKKLILASTSPRRKKLMTEAGLIFDIISPKFDENLINKIFSYKKIEEIAENKCESVAKEIHFPAIIVSADTVVVYNNIVMGKPKDYEEAFNMLNRLSGKKHIVVTAICIKDTENKEKIIKSETSEVTFNEISNYEIEKYIKDNKPYDKAGSYGIQELNKHFIKNIKGDYNNIVGLPTKMLIKMLNEINNQTV